MLPVGGHRFPPNQQGTPAIVVGVFTHKDFLVRPPSRPVLCPRRRLLEAALVEAALMLVDGGTVNAKRLPIAVQAILATTGARRSRPAGNPRMDCLGRASR